MTCIHCDPGVDCAHDRADDVWLTSADLRGGLTDLVRVHETDVALGAGRMCGYGHPLRGSASAHGEWWCHPSCDCHPDCYRVATASMSGTLAPEQPDHAPALTRDGFSEALRALGRDGGEHV